MTWRPLASWENSPSVYRRTVADLSIVDLPVSTVGDPVPFFAPFFQATTMCLHPHAMAHDTLPMLGTCPAPPRQTPPSRRDTEPPGRTIFASLNVPAPAHPSITHTHHTCVRHYRPVC